MDDPTATPTAYLDRNTRQPSSSIAANAGGEDSDGEDEAPDYLRLLSSLNPKSNSSSSAAGPSAGIVIPKRGEKDFEPTGFGGQAKLLERSREAMFQAVSGERRVGSRSLVRATWDATTRRARLHDVQGKIFETVGVIRREQIKDEATGKLVTKAWNELLPEEALFLAERGSLQIYQQGQTHEQALAPMSLQQAFTALMLPAEGGISDDAPLTRESYLIYAYLKRLGYVVQRASIVDAVRAAPLSASTLAKKNQSQSSSQSASKAVDAQGVVADPQRPIKLVTVWDVLLYIPRRIAQLAGDAASTLARWVQSMWHKIIGRFIHLLGAAATKVLGSTRRTNVASLGMGLGLRGRNDGRRFLGEKGNVAWDSYDAVFSSLQVIPSSHDFWVPSPASSQVAPTSAAQLNQEATSVVQQRPGSEARPDDGLKPFYYAWRPATLYRKSHPPPPEFRIVILNARTTPLPSLWQFESIFAQIPIPGSDQELFGSLGAVGVGGEGEGEGLDEAGIRERVEYEKQLKASNEAKNRAAYGKFSQGKQKHLREKAAARQAAAASRAQSHFPVAGKDKSLLQRFSNTVAKALVKVLLLDFAPLNMVAKLFSHCPPGCSMQKRSNSRHYNKFKGTNAGAGVSSARGGGGNVFPPLKAGRRSMGASPPCCASENPSLASGLCTEHNHSHCHHNQIRSNRKRWANQRKRRAQSQQRRHTPSSVRVASDVIL